MLGDGGFRLSLLHWVNDALLTIFFLVVGLEIKREFTVGHLAKPARRGAADRGGAGRHGRAGADLRRARPRRALVARLGGADGDRHRLRGRADRGDGGAGAGRAAHLPDRGGDRRRHRRDHRRGAVLLRRAAPRRARRGGGGHRRARAPQPLARLCAGALHACSGSRSGSSCTRAGCTRRSRACCSRSSSRPGSRPTSARWWRRRRRSSTPRRGAAPRRCTPARRCRRCACSTSIHDRLRIAGRPAAAPRRRPVELPRAAGLRAGQRRRRASRRRCSRGAARLMLPIVAGLAIGKPLGIVAPRRSRSGPASRPSPTATRWRQLAGAGALAGIGFTMSLVHRRPGLRRSRRLRRRQDRGLRRLDPPSPASRCSGVPRRRRGEAPLPPIGLAPS